MKIICVDDASIHLSALLGVLKTLELKGEMKFEVVKTCVNGAEGVKAFQGNKSAGIKIDIVFLDIRMPVMDGLSALVKIKSIDPSIKCIMASSEDEATVAKAHGNRPANSMSTEKKISLLDKIAERISSDIKEEGKINLILDGCEELLLDPIEIAKHYKANGYLHKPYNVENTQDTIKQVMAGSGFVFLK